jgi:regulation of enolase protein 1 (concanavalin A-like superfamily)
VNAPILDERFRSAVLDTRLQWLNPPQRWQADPALPALVVEPEGQTDFWQRTHYGFEADNGHLLSLEVEGNFSLATQVRFHPVHQYDQAGLMIRADKSCWIKTSVEHEPEGRPQLGVVVTNGGYSDWSLQDFPFEDRAVALRIRKRGDDVLVEFAPPNVDRWTLMRVARLHCPQGIPLRAGLYACSPKGPGFRAEFAYLRIDRLGDEC